MSNHPSPESPPEDIKRKPVTMRLDPRLIRQIRAWAKQHKTRPSWVIELAIQSFLNRHEQDPQLADE